jgi:hypothetical protein
MILCFVLLHNDWCMLSSVANFCSFLYNICLFISYLNFFPFSFGVIYMVVMMSYAFMYRYIGDGPTWASHIELADTCRERWWYHILYVNNLVGTDGHTAYNMFCIMHTYSQNTIEDINYSTHMTNQ